MAAKNGKQKLGERNQELLFKALANRRRLRILRYLMKHGEKSVSDISAIIGVSFKSSSKHLKVLLNAKLVSEKKKGFYVLYTISESLHSLPKSIMKQI